MMKKHEFTNGELTEKAMEVYSNSSFTFWENFRRISAQGTHTRVGRLSRQETTSQI